MKRTNNYSEEEFWVNSTLAAPSDAEIRVYSYCNSCWFKGSQINIRRDDSPYCLYSLNLSGSMETENQNSGEVINYAPGTFTFSKVNGGQYIARVNKLEPLVRKFILVQRNILHDMIIDKMFQGSTYFKLWNIDAVEMIMNKFYSVISSSQDIDNAYLSGLFFQLLHELHGQMWSGNYPQSLQKALNYISYTFDKPNLDRAKIAEAAGVSIRTLSNLFLKYLGIQCFNYVIDLRLTQVCRMLVFSDLLISEIAEKCGFTTPNFLARTFRKKYNMTPRDYRMKHRSLY